MKIYALIAVQLFASAAFARSQEIPAGSNVLDVREVSPAASTRSIRQEIESIDKRIVILNSQIRSTQATANVGTALRGVNAQFNSTPSGQEYALAAANSGLELQRSQLIAKRTELKSQLENAAAVQ